MIIQLIKKLRLKRKLRDMDDFSHLWGTNSYSLFPPSYKERFSPEEYKKMVEDELVILRKLVEELPDGV